jgi:hypothetical protein
LAAGGLPPLTAADKLAAGTGQVPMLSNTVPV